MTTTQMFLWIAITTIYGFATYKFGYVAGVKQFSEVLVKAKVVRSQKELHSKLMAFSEAENAEDEEQ